MKSIYLFLFFGVLVIPMNLSAEPLMYVPSGEANEIIIIDLSTDTITGHIEGLENSHGLSGSPKADYLVAGSMKQIENDKKPDDQKTGERNEETHTAHHVNEMKESAKTTQSFVAIVHPEHGHVMRRIGVRGLTHHTAVSPDGKTAVAVHSGAGGISVIDLESLQVSKTLQTGEWPNYAIFSHNGRWLYVSNAQPGTISEIDTETWEIKREIKVGKEPEHLVIASDDSKLYVANVGDGTAAVVDLVSGGLTKTFAVGAQPHGIDISSDGHWLFVSSKAEGKLVRIDLKDDRIETIGLQPAPYHLKYVDGTKKLYVSSRKQPKIWVIDPMTLAVLKTIALGEGVAHQMVVLEQ